MRLLSCSLICLLFFSVDAVAQTVPAILPAAPRSGERGAPIEALKRKGPALARAFSTSIHANASGETMPYRLFTPEGPGEGQKVPLIVFLHGSGGSGTENLGQLQRANMFGALVWTLPENQKRHPAFVLAPQTDVNWGCVIPDPARPARVPAELKKCPPEVLGTGARLAFEIIDGLLSTLPIDRSRIYVTGHSMGGFGAWHMIAHRPDFFAAAVPVCGDSDPATAPRVKDVPIWCFHGAADDVVPARNARGMIEAVRKAGGRPLYTEYPGVGHNVFMWAYTEPALAEWLFARRR